MAHADPSMEKALADPAAAPLAKPTSGQIEWADMELQMFVHFGVATWKGSEYDSNGQMDLSKMNPAAFDAEQICRVAKSWGAKQVILVCKHVGGFCWWPTETTEYSVKNIPWKNGNGNLVKEVADACRKNGLKMGIYLYSDDTRYAKGIGRGGRTDDPQRQEEWNQKLRQQWTEVLTICGPDLVREVWFDGGCIVPLADIIRKLAPSAEIFGGPLATVRWPGTESGKLPDPCWSSIGTGVKSDGEGAGMADGQRWCPPECDTVLYGRGGHHWFWSAKNEAQRHTTDELMDIYLKSVGRGGMLLLNSSPNTDGLIPADDVKRYEEFGAEIHRRFGSPLAKTSGVGDTLELDLGGLHKVNQASLMEDTRGGHRIRAYVLEGREASGKWQPLTTGSSVGHKRIAAFATTIVDRLRLRITKYVGTPMVRELAAFYVTGLKPDEVVSLTQGKPATASSTHSAPYLPAMATDGNPNTRWAATDSDTLAWLEVDLGDPTTFGKVSLSELADRVQEFVIESRNDKSSPWLTAFTGTIIGSNFEQEFPQVTGRFVRLRVVKGGDFGPTLWKFELARGKQPALPCGSWKKEATNVTLDLTPHIPIPATYEVTLPTAVNIRAAKLLFNGAELPKEDCTVQGNRIIIRQTQQVTDQTKTTLTVEFAPAASAGEAKIRMVSGS